MPNFVSILEESDYLHLKNSNDGEIYGVGLKMDVDAAYSTMIRSDWLTNLGLEFPKTWDDWVNVWTAFKNEDANGNGNPNDEIPLALRYDQFYLMLNAFGINSNGHFSVVDGEYVYDPENPNYVQFLEAMKGLYKDGILFEEYITCDSTQLSTIGSGNTLGSTVTWAEQAKNYSLAAQEIDDDALFSSITPITGPDDDSSIAARSKWTVNTYVTQEAVDSGKINQILKTIDYIFSEEGITLTNYGIEGQHYDVVDGKNVMRPEYTESFVAARTIGLIPTTIPFYFATDTYMQILYNGATYEDLTPAGKSFIDGMTINDDYYYNYVPLLITDAYSKNSDLVAEQDSLRDQYIIGQITMEQYESEYEILKDAGLNDIIEQAKEAYNNVK